MEKLINVAQIIIPILVTILIGAFAKKRKIISEEENNGLQQFVMKFGLPCVLFNSCLACDLKGEAITSMCLVFPLVFLSSYWAFQSRKKNYPYYNLPMIFSAQESGMLGIPLFMTLFGTEQAYRMGVLDMSQSLIAIPVIAILSSDIKGSTNIIDIIKKVFQSPLLLMSLLGLFLNLSGLINHLNQIGIGQVITETTSFISTPVSAVILFSVGYNFSISEGNKQDIYKICGIHISVFMIFCAIMQLGLMLIENVQMETRIAILLYCSLPPSFLSSSFGKTKEEKGMASSVCSLCTILCLIVFCVLTIFVS